VHVDEARQRKLWWAARRWAYNGILLLGLAVSAAICLVLALLFGTRLPCLEINGFALIAQVIGFPVLLGLANACYSLGRFSEWLLRPVDIMMYRQNCYRLGVAVTLMLIFIPPFLLSKQAFFDASCIDKFGEKREISR
jgi:hypothetical protein